MEFPLLGLIRLAAIAGLGLSVVAVGLGRMNPAPGGGMTPAPIEWVGVGGTSRGRAEAGYQLLDLKTGRVERLDRSSDELVDLLSCSACRDSRGRSRLVGRRIGFGAGSAPREFGLVRLSYPDGTELDRVATDVVPSAPPCWYPGSASRILYSACDGSLYHFDFGAKESPDRDHGQGDSLAPRPLTWRNPARRLVDARMLEPIWLVDPAYGARIIVSLSSRGTEGTGRYEGAKLWWLQPDSAGNEIIAAGRLTRPDPARGPDSEVEERFPALARPIVGGPCLLTYLARTEGKSLWQIRLAPVRVEPGTGRPAADLGRGRVLAEACETLTPTLSLDGRWVAACRRLGAGPASLVRIPVAGPGPRPAG